uniref:Abl interactor 2 n=1 Tax=Hirondellea gigas TaxID=1518452 RepID=A0A6A7FQR4_9CRUS
MALSSEFVTLVQQEIPEGRQSLTDSHANLDKVAAYCIENFARAPNKQAALDETKNYTTQSLASVAYQINTLAYNFLQMMDQQSHQLAEMESQVNYIAEMVMIHKEKVARREIGVLTTNKSITRQFKILAPANTEKPIKYVRKAIDFNRLDEIGHGVRSAGSSTTPRSRRSNASSTNTASTGGIPVSSTPVQMSGNASSSGSGSTVGGGGIYAPSAGPPPTTKPPTPPQSSRTVNSLARGSREYRTPPAVAPPQVPINYAPNYPIGHPRRNESAQQQQAGQRGYSTLPHPPANPPPPSSPAPPPPPPQVGMVHPMTQQQQPGGGVYAPGMQQQEPQQSHYALNQSLGMPPPPSPASSGLVSELDYPSHRSSGASSPPLPPPPPHDGEAVTLVPPVYVEKVIAVYDYTADKDDELSFSENATIYVLKKNDDGWWEGVLNGVTGLFPGNYVEPLM